MNASNTIIKDAPVEAMQKAQTIIDNLPQWVWSTTMGKTFFRVNGKTLDLLPPNYVPKDGDLVFALTNLNGFISIERTYPLDNDK